LIGDDQNILDKFNYLELSDGRWISKWKRHICECLNNPETVIRLVDSRSRWLNKKFLSLLLIEVYWRNGPRENRDWPCSD
jgi:hypothetical protein